MTGPIFSTRLFSWIARVLAIAFVGLLAFAWWDESQARQDPQISGGNTDWFWQWAIWTHVLPVVVLTIAIIWGWKKPLVGVIGFGLYAVAQLFAVGDNWVALPYIAAPPALIALAYLVSFLLGRKIKA